MFRIRLGSGSAIGSYGPTRMSSIHLYKTQMCNVTVFFCDSLDPNPSLMFSTLGEGLGCVLIKSTLGFRETQKGGMQGAMGSNGGQRGTVYEQPGTKEDHSCHSWRAPSK